MRKPDVGFAPREVAAGVYTFQAVIRTASRTGSSQAKRLTHTIRSMTNYNLKPITLPSLAAQEAKAARQKQLAAVRKRRAQIARARQEKERSFYQTSEEYKEYQVQLQEEARVSA